MEIQGFRGRQVISITLLMIAGFLVFTAEGLIYYLEDAPLALVIYSFGSAAFCALNFLILRWLGWLNASVYLTLLLVFATSAFVVKTGGQDGTGIFWAVTAPLIFFLLTGKKRGLALSILLFLIVLVALILNYFSVIDTAFKLIDVREPTLIYIVIMICGATMEYFRELGEQNSLKYNKETSGANKQLENEIKSRKKIEEQLKNHSQEMEKLNKLMIGRELKMVELKKELDLLKGKGNKG